MSFWHKDFFGFGLMLYGILSTKTWKEGDSMQFSNTYVQSVYDGLEKRYPEQKEFLEAAGNVLFSLQPVVEKNPQIEKFAILERITEPERTIMFRVPWVDDN